MPVKPKPLPPLSVLKAAFLHDPKTGRLINKVSRTSRKAGEFAESYNVAGYAVVHLNGKNYLAHRVIWKMIYGKDPVGYLDHKNSKDRSNNRKDNLREATHQQNMFNLRVRRDSSTGIKGVHRRKGSGKFRAYISVSGRREWLGNFPTIEEAAAAVRQRRIEIHGAYASH